MFDSSDKNLNWMLKSVNVAIHCHHKDTAIHESQSRAGTLAHAKAAIGSILRIL